MRPTNEQRLTYESVWKDYLQTPDSTLKTLMGCSPSLDDHIHEQFIAACFLEDTLKSFGTTTPDYRRDRCFTFGRMCFGRDVWTAFDKMLASCQATHQQVLTESAWATMPLPQNVPPPTPFLTNWYNHAKSARGDKGVYPQVFWHQDPEGHTTIEALAIDGDQAFDRAIHVFRTTHPTEFVLGVDMQALPNQDIEFNDFLTVIWYTEGQFYTGVINYQLSGDAPTGEDTEPAFREIRWDNNFWNHSLRIKSPIPQMLTPIETPKGAEA